MPVISLTPHATLHWTESGPGSPQAPEDWRERLFLLAAMRSGGEFAASSAAASAVRNAEDAAVLRFWGSFAETLLAALCRLPEDAGPSDMSARLMPPSDADYAAWLEGAPPMPGGEYLSRQSLQTIRDHLLAWCAAQTEQAGGLSAFLERRAPRWRRVGRVTFHLAENKADPDNPFAFLATYTVALNQDGRPVHQVLGEALQRYAGEADKSALISLLSPVRSAADHLTWVADMVENGAVYRPQPFSIARAHRMLLDVPVLERNGLVVSIPDWWRTSPRPQVRVTIGETGSPGLGVKGLLDWKVDLALGDQALDEADIRELFEAGDGLVLFKGRWIEADSGKLQQALACWEQARAAASEEGVSFAQAMRMLAGMPLAGTALNERLPDEPEEASGSVFWPHVEPGAALRSLLEQLRCPGRGGAPAALEARLRPYQQEGLDWLSLLSGLGLGACLADDMGLGKTIQVLALLLRERERRSSDPSLLVVPASLLGNWRAEAGRFAPGLRLHFYHPAECGKDQLARWEAHPEELRQADLVITSYAMLTRNSALFSAHSWHLLIADEAQAIKNPGTRQSRALKSIPAGSRIALTGTPIENRLSDLWSLFDFINPGLLGSAGDFKTALRRLEKREQEPYAPLRRLVSPYILRRLKTDRRVIDDLPDKTESVLYCHLTPAQARLYDRLVQQLARQLDELKAEAQSDAKRRGLVLQSLMRLKQLCNHPAQLTGEPDWNPAKSGKFARVAELCRELAERQERVLVFTQFREIIDPLSRHLTEIFGRQGLILHGGTGVGKRKELVDAFQREDGPPFFLLSLKAGGTGLNLTSAGQVIHFDRWWNPAVEDQATDRAYRIGQKKHVLVHKCVTRGTLEERIDALIAGKRRLAGELLNREGEVNLTTLDDNALLDLVRLDLNRAVV